MKPEETPAKVPAMDKQVGDAQWRSYGAEPGVWSERMLAALDKGVKGNKWFSLIDKVFADRTLGLAWAKVSSNAGACGVDGITVERFGKDSQKRLLVVKEHLKEGSYQPKPVKRVMIPKPGSAQKRPLGIPTVRDRVVQTALRAERSETDSRRRRLPRRGERSESMVIEPIFDKEFAPHSYGFRPGRGCKDALRQVNALLKSGHVHVVDADLKSYFDTIPHHRLMALVAERIADGRVKTLIEAFLKQGVLEDGVQWEAGEEGTPQGGVISPLLANLYLNPLDWLMADAGFAMVRYADDFVVLCHTPEQAQHALEKIKAWTQEVELTLHPEKTRTVDMSTEKSHFDFLGYRFYRTRKGKLTRLVRPKSEQKLRATLKPLTQRNCGLSLEITIRRINPTLKGWYAYFKQATPQSLKGMDSWVRDRLRAILRRRRGWKGKAQKPDRFRWPNRYFSELGLFCLEEAQKNETANLRRRGTR